MYPIMLNVENRLCTIIGGGKVALHKAAKLAESGAKVKVISTNFIDGFESFNTVKKEYVPSDIEGSSLVIAATDDLELNKKIVHDAHKLNILASVADNAAYSDFISPASVTNGDITLSISTNGKFPLLAKKLCYEKAADLDNLSEILPLLEEYRRRIIKINGKNKLELLEFMLSEEMLECARNDTAVFKKKIEKRLLD